MTEPSNAIVLTYALCEAYPFIAPVTALPSSEARRAYDAMAGSWHLHAASWVLPGCNIGRVSSHPAPQPRRCVRDIAIFLLACGLGSVEVHANDLRVLVSGIEPIGGEIHCLLFNVEDGFPMRRDLALASLKYAPAGELLTCTFPDVAPGRYAVSVFHDLDGNAAYDGRFGDDPKEPWGITNNLRPTGRPPQFVEAVIYVGSLADYEVVLRK